MPPKINLATILLGVLRGLEVLLEVVRLWRKWSLLLPPLFEVIKVVINVNGLWIAKHSDNGHWIISPRGEPNHESWFCFVILACPILTVKLP